MQVGFAGAIFFFFIGYECAPEDILLTGRLRGAG